MSSSICSWILSRLRSQCRMSSLMNRRHAASRQLSSWLLARARSATAPSRNLAKACRRSHWGERAAARSGSFSTPWLAMMRASLASVLWRTLSDSPVPLTNRGCTIDSAGKSAGRFLQAAICMASRCEYTPVDSAQRPAHTPCCRASQARNWPVPFWSWVNVSTFIERHFLRSSPLRKMATSNFALDTSIPAQKVVDLSAMIGDPLLVEWAFRLLGSGLQVRTRSSRPVPDTVRSHCRDALLPLGWRGLIIRLFTQVNASARQTLTPVASPLGQKHGNGNTQARYRPEGRCRVDGDNIMRPGGTPQLGRSFL